MGPDPNPPVINSVSPAAGTTNISVGTAVSATFSEAMDQSTITTNTFFLLDPSSNVVSATLAYQPSTLTATLTPSTALDAGTTYTATVVGGPGGVTDVSSNALAADYIWSFTTQAPDTTAPTINSVDPAPDAADVNPNTPISVVFSEARKSTWIM